jgi:hypothetical protein
MPYKGVVMLLEALHIPSRRQFFQRVNDAATAPST